MSHYKYKFYSFRYYSVVTENGLKLWPQRWVKLVGFNKYTMTMISKLKCVERLGLITQ